MILEKSINYQGFFQEAKFLYGITALSQLQMPKYPEIALLGRSNVGKSTIVNLLTNNNKMARVSKTPGRTRQINFFLIRNTFIIADLPGYGYAAAPQDMVNNWSQLMIDYCKTRTQLRQIMLLIDARLGFTKTDMKILELLRGCATTTQIIFTKCDKLTQEEIKQRKEEVFKKIIEREPFIKQDILLSSSKNTKQFDNIHKAIYHTMA